MKAPMRRVGYAVSTAAVVAVSVAGAAYLALKYRDLPGDRRSAWFDRMIAKAAEALTGSEDGGFDDRFWMLVREQLPSDVKRRPGAFFLQVLAEPRALPIDSTPRMSTMARLCDQLPEWMPHAYLERQDFSVARGYQTFLYSLNPLMDGVGSTEERGDIARTIDGIRKLLEIESASAVPESSPALREALSSVEKTVSKYQQFAKRKGYPTVGPAQFVPDLWNAGFNRSVAEGTRAWEIKECVAEGLEEWWAERKRLELGLSASRATEGWQQIDLGNAQILPAGDPVEALADDQPADSVRLQARRIKVFTLRRPGWFKPEAIRLYARSNLYRPEVIDNPSSDLWGPSGLFNLLPVAVVVVDAPSATFSLPRSQAEELLRWSADTTTKEPLSLGGVSIQRSSTGLSVGISSLSSEIVAPARTDMAHVVAVLSLKLPAAPLQ